MKKLLLAGALVGAALLVTIYGAEIKQKAAAGSARSKATGDLQELFLGLGSAREDALQRAREFLAAGADVNAFFLYGSEALDQAEYTPLMVALSEGNSAIVELFVKHGANVNAQPAGMGTAPLHAAIASRNTSHPISLETLQLLLDAGANIDAQAHTSRMPGSNDPIAELTPLLLALAMAQQEVENGRVATENIKSEVESGIMTKEDAIPLLRYWLKKPMYDTVKWLLEQGADPTITDDQGHDAFHYAQGNEDLKKLLAPYRALWKEALVASVAPHVVPGPAGIIAEYLTGESTAGGASAPGGIGAGAAAAPVVGEDAAGD